MSTDPHGDVRCSFTNHSCVDLNVAWCMVLVHQPQYIAFPLKIMQAYIIFAFSAKCNRFCKDIYSSKLNLVLIFCMFYYATKIHFCIADLSLTNWKLQQLLRQMKLRYHAVLRDVNTTKIADQREIIRLYRFKKFISR